jgi:hypothetical protein
MRNWTSSNNEGAQSLEAESYVEVLPTLTEDSSEGTQSVEEQQGAPAIEGSAMPTVTEDNALPEDSIEVLALQPPVVTRRLEGFRLTKNPRRESHHVESLPVTVENVAAEPVVHSVQPVPADSRFPRGNPVQEDDSAKVSHDLEVVRVLKANASSGTVKASNPKEQDDDFVCEIDETGTKVCPPHKTEILEEQISSTKPGIERRNAVIRSLQEMRVRVYVIEGKSIRNTKEILDHIRRVVGFVARENRIHEKTGPLGYQRCLLYQDPDGRLFNLTLAKHAVGPAS